MDNETLVIHGGEIKALGNGKIGGYLVRFGDASKTDLEGEYFTADTDFDIADNGRASVYYHHGLDPVLKQRKIGVGDMRFDGDIGIWVEAQLEMRDEYERAVYGMAKSGKLGWSSGTAPHLMTKTGNQITRWPIVEASVTPTPAEPRTQAVALKALANPTSGPVEVCAFLDPLSAQMLSMMEPVATPEDQLRVTIEMYPGLSALESAAVVTKVGAMTDRPPLSGQIIGYGRIEEDSAENSLMVGILDVDGLPKGSYVRLGLVRRGAPLPVLNDRQFPMVVGLYDISILSEGDREDFPFTSKLENLPVDIEPELPAGGEAAMPEDARSASATVPNDEALAIEIELLTMEMGL